MKKTLVAAALVSLVFIACNKAPNQGAAPAAPEGKAADANQNVTRKAQAAAINWDSVTTVDAEQQQALSLLLKADSLTGAKQGDKIGEWRDLSANKFVFSQSGEAFKPTFIANAANGKPALSFNGPRSGLITPVLPGSKFLSKNEMTFLVVMKEAPGINQNDGFGWGDCQMDRFIFHLSYENQLIFQMGRSVGGSISSQTSPNWNTQFQILTIVRRQNEAKIALNGRASTVANMQNLIDTDKKFPIRVGTGPCGNGFKGEIAELQLYNKGLGESELQGLTKSLAQKYGITLQ